MTLMKKSGETSSNYQNLMIIFNTYIRIFKNLDNPFFFSYEEDSIQNFCDIFFFF